MIAPPPELSSVPPAHLGGASFLRRLQLATYVIILLVLTIYLLDKFREILQPLFIALFLGFLMQPIQRWLVNRGIPATIAYGLIVTIVALGVFAFGSMMYANITQVAEQRFSYETRLETRVRDLGARMPFAMPTMDGHFLRGIFTPDQLAGAVSTALGRFGDFSSWAALTFIYLLFLIAEKVSFPRRMVLAFGTQHGEHIMNVVESITEAIGEYIAVKTLASAIGGLLSYGVLALFDVEFAATWGILIFVLNYIPYLGSMVACSLPIILSFLQFDDPWKGIVITIALIGIQQIIGNFVEPRIAGQRLDVSPLLILLSLAFWGSVWGIIGMILAVPLLVIVRIILDNIPETKPIATLISNR
jgi:predicted PurR-regulated permease PerM